MIDTKIKIQRNNFIFNHYTFKSPANTQFQVHSHNAYEIVFFLRGNVNYIIEDKRYQLKPNDIVLIRPNRYHYIEILDDTPYERYNILFDKEEFLHLFTDLLPSSLEHISHCDNFIVEIFKKTDFYYSKLTETEFIDLFFSFIKELVYNLKIHSSENKSYDIISPILSSTLKYINDNLFTVKDVSEISKKLYISESYLFKIFKEQLKISPKKYINNKRLLIAQKLLYSGKRPTEIYLQCGFQTYTSFYKQYLKLFGCPPSQLTTTSIIPTYTGS